MKESEIREKVIKIKEKEGKTCWWPPKPRFSYKETDIFGAFDVICIDEQGIELIQLTDITNFSHRKKKVKKWLNKNNVWPTGFSEIIFQVMAYNKKKEKFKIYDF